MMSTLDSVRFHDLLGLVAERYEQLQAENAELIAGRMDMIPMERIGTAQWDNDATQFTGLLLVNLGFWIFRFSEFRFSRYILFATYF